MLLGLMRHDWFIDWAEEPHGEIDTPEGEPQLQLVEATCLDCGATAEGTTFAWDSVHFKPDGEVKACTIWAEKRSLEGLCDAARDVIAAKGKVVTFPGICRKVY